MGYWKEKEIEEQEQGFNSPPDKYVCAKHFEDYPLRDFIEGSAIRGHCDYCTRPYMHCDVVPLKELVTHMHDIVSIYFDNPDNVGVPYAKYWVDEDDDESSPLRDRFGYVATKNRDIYDENQLFEGLLNVDNEDLYGDIVDCFGQHLWGSKNYFNFTKWEELDYYWKCFCEKIKSSIEYSYFNLPPLEKYDDSENGLDHILSELGSIVREHKLVKTLSVGTGYYRVRNHKTDEEAADFKGLAAPPADRVKRPNRMSPVGVSMFYGSESLKLCLDEAQINKETPPEELMTSFGKFELKRELNVIDFTELPEQPNFWAGIDNSTLAFLYSFSKVISHEVDDDKPEDYIPTQVMTGFFQRTFSKIYGDRIDGLVYESAREEGGRCCVLFFDNNQCPEYLKLVQCETKPYAERNTFV